MPAGIHASCATYATWQPGATPPAAPARAAAGPRRRLPCPSHGPGWAAPQGSISPRAAASRLLLPLPTGPVMATRELAGTSSWMSCRVGPCRSCGPSRTPGSPAASALVAAGLAASQTGAPQPKLPATATAQASSTGLAPPTAPRSAELPLGAAGRLRTGPAVSQHRRKSDRRRTDTIASTTLQGRSSGRAVSGDGGGGGGGGQALAGSGGGEGSSGLADGSQTA